MALERREMSRLRGRRDRILAHLRKFASDRYSATMPEEVTQSGISAATRISRSHVSEILDGMVKEGIIDEEMHHVRNSGRRARVYLLTHAGMRIAQELVESVIQKKTVHFTSQMPQVRHFYGRERETRDFKRWLSSEYHMLAIRGIAGVGKTTFVSRMTEKFLDGKNLFWYRFYEWGSLKNLLMQLGEFLQRCGKTRLRRYAESSERADIAEVAAIIDEDLADIDAVLILDDIHKAEERAVQLMGPLVESIGHSRNVRAIVIGRHIPGFYDLRDTALRRNVAELELTGLDRSSSRALARAAHGPHVDFDRLFDLTRGNPLAIELIKDASDTSGDSDLTRYIQGEVYSKLSPDERSVMGRISVFRYPIDRRALSIIEAGADALDSLSAKGLVSLSGDLYDVHDMFRNFFYSRLTESERRAFHARAASCFSQDSGPVGIVERIYHLAGAGLQADAIRLASKTSHALIAAGFSEELAKTLSGLERELERVSHEDKEGQKKRSNAWQKTQAEALRLLGEAAYASGKPDDAFESFGRAYSLFISQNPSNAPGRSEVLASMCRKAGAILWGKGDYEGARSWFEKGLVHAGKRNGTEAGRLHGWLGWAYYSRGDFKGSLAHHKKALAIAMSIGDCAEIATARNDLGTYHHAFCEWNEALVHYTEALRVKRGMGDRVGTAAVLNNMANIHEAMGNPARAVDLYKEGINLLRETGDLANQSVMLTSLAQAQLELGDRREALTNLARSIDISRKLGDRLLSAMANLATAEAWLASGDLEKAVGHCNESIRLASAGGYQTVLGTSYCLMGEILAARHEWHSASAYIRNSIDILGRLSIPRQLGRSHQALWRTLRSQHQETGDTLILEEAMSSLEKAKSIYAKVRAHGDLGKIQKESAKAQQEISKSKGRVKKY